MVVVDDEVLPTAVEPPVDDPVVPKYQEPEPDVEPDEALLACVVVAVIPPPDPTYKEPSALRVKSPPAVEVAIWVAFSLRITTLIVYNVAGLKPLANPFHDDTGKKVGVPVNVPSAA